MPIPASNIRALSTAPAALRQKTSAESGFEEFVEAMAKPRHPERKRLIEWYGRVFKPEDIDLPAVQANIEKLARRRAIGKAASAKSRQSER